MELQFYSKEYYSYLLGLHVLADYDVSVEKREQHDEKIKVIREGKDINIHGKLELYRQVYGRDNIAG